MRLRERLAALYPAPPPADPEVRDSLERALLKKLPAEPPSPWRRRMLLGGLAGLAFAGACAVPTEYSVDFGQRLAFSVSDGEFDPQSLHLHIRERFDGIEEMRISASKSITQHGEEPAQMKFDVVLDVVGEVDPAAVEASLLERFDALTPTDIDVDALDGTVHGTLGGMLSHRTLGWELDRGGVEAARAQILEEFEAQGLPPPSHVEVRVEERDGPGRREREVRIEVEADQMPEP